MMRPGIVAVALLVCGCASESTYDPAIQDQGPFVARDDLRLRVVLIGSMDDVPRTGSSAWLNVEISNPSSSQVRFCPVGMLGKGAMEKHIPKPGYSALQWYGGFRMSRFTCDFLDSHGLVMHRVMMAPPDINTLKAGEAVSCWRVVTTPPRAGTYRVRVRYDDSDALEWIASTHNSISWEGGPAGAVKVEAFADGVKVDE